MQRNTAYKALRTFDAVGSADEETALDRISDVEAEGKFGSYAQLAHDERFRFRLPVVRQS